MAETADLLNTLQDVLSVVKQDYLIKKLQEIKENYKKGSYQDLVIQCIISNTCTTLFISKDDLLNEKFHCGGKRVHAAGIIGFLIKKIYIPKFSLKQVCKELNNNVSVDNLCRYIRKIEDIKPAKFAADKQTEENLQNITMNVNKFISQNIKTNENG